MNTCPALMVKAVGRGDCEPSMEVDDTVAEDPGASVDVRAVYDGAPVLVVTEDGTVDAATDSDEAVRVVDRLGCDRADDIGPGRALVGMVTIGVGD